MRWAPYGAVCRNASARCGNWKMAGAGGDRDCFDLCEDDNRGQWCHTKKLVKRATSTKMF